MKLYQIALLALSIAGCSQNQDSATAKAPTPSEVPKLVVDASTPDRALKSYWQVKDAVRKLGHDWNVTAISDFQRLKSKARIDNKKLMTSDVLAAHQEYDRPAQVQLKFIDYSREILEIKQDTESRATALVKVRNSTPISAAISLSDSDKKQRAEGEKFRYVLEKEEDGWKVAQVYKYVTYRSSLNGNEPWEKVFSPPTESSFGGVYIFEEHN